MDSKTVMMTGYPGFIGRKLLETLIDRGSVEKVFLLVQEKFASLARLQIESIFSGKKNLADFKILVGDITKDGLDLSDEDRKLVLQETEVFYHLAAVYDLSIEEPIARLINITGTQNVIKLCKEMSNLDRLIYFSTYAISGKRSGRVYESELIDNGFKNHYESTKFQAEVLVRNAMKELPTVILRPGIVVGDSRTGETDKMDGPYFVLRFISRIAEINAFSSGKIPLPSPVSGRGQMNMVPIDFITEASAEVFSLPEAIGKTFHLTDPSPLTVREFFGYACQEFGLRGPYGYVPTPITKTVFRSGRIQNFFQIPKELLDYTAKMVVHDDSNTRSLLGSKGIVPPPVSSYFHSMVQYVQSHPRLITEAKY